MAWLHTHHKLVRVHVHLAAATAVPARPAALTAQLTMEETSGIRFASLLHSQEKYAAAGYAPRAGSAK